MKQPIEELLRFYASIRNLLESVKSTPHQTRRKKPYKFDDVNDLGSAVSTGNAVLGDLVTGKGWLSPYAYWYLPTAYSPFRLDSGYAVENDRWAVKMASAPALLPSGHVPFRRDGKRLAFLYPSDTLGFNLELADSQENQRPREFEPETIDDQPWLYSLDFGFANYSPNPERWIYSRGDTTLSNLIPSPASTQILSDPTRVREVVRVPNSCKPIPVLYPEEVSYLNQHVELTARLVEMDREILAELSGLGAPLAERVFSLFFHQGSHIAPFCIAVDIASPKIRRVSDPTATTHQRPKITTLLSECYFENESSGEPVAFGDDEIVDWFIPAVKDCVFPVGGMVLPDRWIGKVYGFDGPIYIYKSGPLQFSISPKGALSTHMICDVNSDLGYRLELFHNVLATFRQRMRYLYREHHGKDVNIVNMFMTDSHWQMRLGKLLGGKTLDEAIRHHQPYKNLRLQLEQSQSEDRSALIAPILTSFTVQATADVSKTVNQFDKLRHNADLLPLNKRIFDAMAIPNWGLHNLRDFGTDHLLYASVAPKATVSIQVKSHKEILDEDFYDTVLSQRVQSSAYGADLYLILLYGNSLSEQKKPNAKQPEGQIVAGRFNELKRKIEMTDYRRTTEVVSPETIAQIILNLGVSVT